MHRALLIIVLLFGPGACLPLPGGHTLTGREVWSKQGENTLVARDGSSCRVTAPTFERVKVGDDHTCAWREVERSGGGLDRPPWPPRPPATPGEMKPR